MDDEEAIRTIIISMLVSAHYGCREASSGAEALALLESGEEINLLLTDLMMSEMDGIALMEHTKEKYPDMPVVIVSGERDISVALAAIRKGAFDYLMKPFEREQLLATVRRACFDTNQLPVSPRPAPKLPPPAACSLRPPFRSRLCRPQTIGCSTTASAPNPLQHPSRKPRTANKLNTA